MARRVLNLMVHCGSALVDRNAVMRSGTPAATASHVPIPHGRLFELVEEKLFDQRLVIVSEAHAMSEDGMRYFGMVQVAPEGDGEDEGEFGLIVGARNSHDKSISAGLVLGAAPFVCDNLCFDGEIKLARKHTLNVNRDLPGLVESGILSLLSRRGVHTERFDSYKGVPLDDRTAHDLIIRAVDDGAIPNARIPMVLEGWRNPPHPEFEEENLFRLYMSFTDALKARTVFNRPYESVKLHGLLDGHAARMAA